MNDIKISNVESDAKIMYDFNTSTKYNLLPQNLNFTDCRANESEIFVSIIDEKSNLNMDMKIENVRDDTNSVNQGDSIKGHIESSDLNKICDNKIIESGQRIADIDNNITVSNIDDSERSCDEVVTESINLLTLNNSNDIDNSKAQDEQELPNISENSCKINTETVAEEKSQKMRQVMPGIQHFDILKLIGKGAFGSVYIVENKINHKYYAMKVISKRLLRKKNNISYMKSERDILTKVAHPFIVSLHYAFQSQSKLFLIMDFLGGGELFYHLRRNGLILETQAGVYFAEMILAIEFLHSVGVIHRDLKPENVLLRLDGHICITDFGLAKEIGDGITTRTLCGTSEYMAPEMLTRTGYSKGVDWWSLGALFYEMLVGKAPFLGKDQKELDRKILTEKLSLPSFLSSTCHSLLRGMIERDVSKRLGAAKSTMFSIGGVAALKQHAFFQGLNWSDVLHGKVPAPIEISTFQAPSTKSPPSKKSNNNSAIAQTSVLSSIDILASPFDQEFTNQAISYSLLEDCYDSSSVTASALHSTLRTPAILSGKDGDEIENSDEYVGFEYQASGPFMCTEEDFQKFEQELTTKLIKLQKKRNQKLKQQQQQQQQQQVVSSTATLSPQQYVTPKQATPEISLTPALTAKEIESNLKKQREAEKQTKQAIQALELEYDQNSELVKSIKSKLLATQELEQARDRVNKRIRLLKKKQREIVELEQKALSLQSTPLTPTVAATQTKPPSSSKSSSKKGKSSEKPPQLPIISPTGLNAEQLEKISKKKQIDEEMEALEEELEELNDKSNCCIPDDELPAYQRQLQKEIDDGEARLLSIRDSIKELTSKLSVVKPSKK